MKISGNRAVPSGLKKMQEYAFITLDDGKNVFLTGDAGTGKSHVIKVFIESCKNKRLSVMVVAPTGIAALNVGGVTIHRAFDAKVGPLVEKITSIVSVLKDTDVIIVDEISMCRIDLFEYMIKQIMYANIARRRSNQKDIQIVVVGDFFQLPPVVTDEDREILTQYYKKDIGCGFAFQSEYWKYCNFVNICLNEIVRQSNMEFSKNLNMARLGNKGSLTYFQKNSSKSEIKNAILLCGTNKSVDEKNTAELEKLTTPLKEMVSLTIGEVKETDKVVPDIINLKVGARVMTVINDAEDRFRNGSFATVTSIGKEAVTIQLDTGITVSLEPYTWSIKDYQLVTETVDGKLVEKLEQVEIGSYTQFPLKLAWAITIHKSQGQTYDAVNLDPYCWDCGQLYVALSRCKTVENMYFTRILTPNFLKASKEVINFYRSFMN